MLSYFLSPEFTVSDKLVQVLYLLSGFFCMYSGIRSWTKKDSENPFATGFFWFTLGIIVAFGMWLTDFQVGILVCLICIPAAFNRVKRNTLQTPTQEEQRANFNKIGMKTGHTSGKVLSTNVTITFSSGATISNLTSADYESGPGDSGCVVYSYIGSTGARLTLGIHTGASGSGTRYYTKENEVNAALGTSRY